MKTAKSGFTGLADDHVDLPGEGSLEEILRDAVDDGGIRLEEMGVSAAARADPTPPAAAAPSARTPTVTSAPPPPPAPVALAMPRLDVAAAVVPMGLDADRYPEVPDGPDKVAWHNFTAALQRSETAVQTAPRPTRRVGRTRCLTNVSSGQSRDVYLLDDCEPCRPGID